MTEVFKNAQWIWSSADFSENEYGEFVSGFWGNTKSASVRISVCGDYSLFVNGKFVASNQYADFEHYKVYDEIDISDYVKIGENTCCILVWYFGKSGMRYFTPKPGLIYEVICDDAVVLQSDENTMSRKSRAYLSADTKMISPQFGYSFTYDASREDNWISGKAEGFTPSCIIGEKKRFFIRPVKKLKTDEGITGKLEGENGRYMIDFGEEFVGLINIAFNSSVRQKINIAYGEVLKDGHVKRLIQNRDFSFDYIAKEGKNNYTNYMFRAACRYIEIVCEEPIEIEFVKILPQTYDVTERAICLENETDKRIYELCLKTLKLCMLEHYVDCPWREQCLYAFDARNQMLSGYAAFEGGNFEYARANLNLMSKDNRVDRLLSICFPSGDDLVIPSFSLYFVLAVMEYMQASGDLSLGEAVFDKLQDIISLFVQRIKDGLVCRFEGEQRWNFYDWSPHANFNRGTDKAEPDFLINAIMVIALRAFDKICVMLERENKFKNIADELSSAAHERFYNEKSGLFFVSDTDEEPTELANSLAVIAQIADSREASFICEKLCKGELISCSLSMKTFKYDAMLKTDESKYASAVIEEIRRTYEIMLEGSSKTAWETQEG